MTPEQALCTYHSGQTVVVKTLCDLSDIIESQKETVAALELKIATLSINNGITHGNRTAVFFMAYNPLYSATGDKKYCPGR